MARFVIADITDARSIPQELMAIVPNLPSLPVQPILLASQQEYGMFEHFKRYPWVLEAVLYDDQAALLAELREKVIEPAERLANAAVSSSRATPRSSLVPRPKLHFRNLHVFQSNSGDACRWRSNVRHHAVLGSLECMC